MEKRLCEEKQYWRGKEKKSRNSLSNQNILQTCHDRSRVANPSVSKARQDLFPFRYVKSSYQNNYLFSASPYAQWGDNSSWESHPLPCYHRKNSNDYLLITNLNIYNILSEKSVLAIHMYSVKSLMNSLQWKEHHGWQKYNLLFAQAGLRQSGWRDGKEKGWEEKQWF